MRSICYCNVFPLVSHESLPSPLPSHPIGPGGITDLELVPATYTINVTWTAPTGNYETFSVQLNLTALEQEVEKKEQNASPLSFTGLKAGAKYTVTVTTLNGYLRSQPRSRTVFTCELLV